MKVEIRQQIIDIESEEYEKSLNMILEYEDSYWS